MTTSNDTTPPSGLQLRVRVDALPDAVFKALTEPDALTEWLAESAEVALEAGRYEFWGRYVPQGDRARQRLLGAEPGHTLRFGWDLDGSPASSTVELTIEPGEGGTTLVTVSHTEIPTSGSAQVSTLHCFWHVSLGNLACHCEGTPLAPQVDFTLPAQGEARVRTVIAAPVDEVFASLLDAAQVSRWCKGTAVIEPVVGGRYDFGWDHGPVTIVELEPDRALAYTWRLEGSPDTRVHWELRGSRGSTFLTLTHSGFVDDALAEKYRQGWPGFLMEVKRMLELGPRWEPIQA